MFLLTNVLHPAPKYTRNFPLKSVVEMLKSPIKGGPKGLASALVCSNF